MYVETNEWGDEEDAMSEAEEEEAMAYESLYCGPGMVQRAATRCNTLQHTAAHCNMLQHTCMLRRRKR